MTSLSERIYEERKKNGLSQSDLADKLNVSTKAVSKWETGESQPTLENINRLCEIFGVTSDYLIGGKALNSANQDKHGNFQYLEDQKSKRRKFRIIGWVLLPIGILCGVYGLIHFLDNFSSVPNFDFGGIVNNSKTGMICSIVGGFVTLASIVFLILGYGGALARYTASEVAPVQRDTTNYLLDGTREETGKTVKTIIDSVSHSSPNGGEGPVCPKCGTLNEKGAAFCDHCGAPLTRKCPYCGENNDSDAKHCRHCGAELK